jgi:hypothetical protein
MPDGSFLEGAQGNLVGRLGAAKLRTSPPATLWIREKEWVSFSKIPKELPERNKRPRSSRLVIHGTAE